MRLRVGRLAERLLLLGGPAVGVLVTTSGVGPGPIGRTTSAACASGLPGTGARCDSDRVVAGLSPYVGPALLGLALGLATAVAVVLVLRLVGRALGTRATAGAAIPAQPAWLVARPGTPAAGPAASADGSRSRSRGGVGTVRRR